ncbi:MAG: low molecular weight phosphotyrosine protein phosphatase [Sphingobium sp.]|nr:low molecular weight phosphotyrosine protein phosphatase [Sphingobium sp.]
MVMKEQTEAAILFVCLGNICRSPLAEAAFRHHAELAGLDVEIDSAGTGRWHIGNPPDPRAQSVARKHGIETSHYQARQLEDADFHRFTHIFALDHDNLADIRARAPEGSRAHIMLLLDLVEGWEGQAVADPYYGDDSGFDDTWHEVSEAALALAALLQKS